MAAKKRIYRIVFQNQGRVFEIYARSIASSGIFGFLEVEGLQFGEKSAVVVDPSEDALRREFEGVERTYIPLHAIIRVDEVEKRGASRIHPVAPGDKVTPIYTPIRRE